MIVIWQHISEVKDNLWLRSITANPGLFLGPLLDQHVHSQQRKEMRTKNATIEITGLRVTACVAQNKRHPVLYRQEGERWKHQNTKAEKAELPCMYVYEWKCCFITTCWLLTLWQHRRGAAPAPPYIHVYVFYIVYSLTKICWWYAESSICKAAVTRSVYAAVPRNYNILKKMKYSTGIDELSVIFSTICDAS